MKVYIVVDHDGYPTGDAFTSRETAQAHIDELEKDESAWQRETYGWKVLEQEVRS